MGEIQSLLTFFFLFQAERLVSRTSFFPLWYLFSTFLHELSHYVFALVLGGKPTLPSLFPRKAGDTWYLGRVIIRNPNALNLLPSSIAPLSLFLVGMWLYFSLPDHTLYERFLRDVLCYFSFSAGLPSLQDVKTGFSSPLGVFLWSGFLAVLLTILRI